MSRRIVQAGLGFVLKHKKILNTWSACLSLPSSWNCRPPSLPGLAHNDFWLYKLQRDAESGKRYINQKDNF